VTPNYDGMLQFIVPAIRQANPSGSIKTASFNGTPSVLKEIGKGIVTADVGQSNRWIGWATADQVLRVMTGTAPVADEKIPVRVWNATDRPLTSSSGFFISARCSGLEIDVIEARPPSQQVPAEALYAF